MLRRLFFSLLILAGAAVIFKYSVIYTQELKKKETGELIHTTAVKLANSMKPDELAGQVIHIALPEKVMNRTAETELSQLKPGGIILFGKNLGTKAEISGLTGALQKFAASISLPGLIISTDQEGGRVIRVQDGVTRFPGAMAIGQTGDPELARKSGFITSHELEQLGINVFFAPDMDINNNPGNPVINTRSFGADAATVASMAVAFETGARAGGSVPVIKHFPGHGDTNTDSHLGLPVIHKTVTELEQFELVPFKKSIESGAIAVMSAHIVYPEIDRDFPATLSKTILTGLLRGKMKFDGVVFTDAMEMHAISKNYQKSRPAVLAILAGADIILYTSWGKEPENGKKEILEAYQNGEFNAGERDLLKEAVVRQLVLKLQSGIITDPALQEFRNLQLSAINNEADTISPQAETINRIISEQSVKSWKKDFQRLEKNQIIQLDLQHRLVQNTAGVKTGTGKDIPLLMDSFDEKDLKRIKKNLQKYPGRKIIVLHYGNPFIEFPAAENLHVLLSFSPTPGSVTALFNAVFKNGNQTLVKKADLIFH